MPDNTVLNAGSTGDTIRNLARQAGTVKTQTFQLDLGGATANAEVLITAGQKTMALSVPVVIASDQPALPVSIAATVNVNNGLAQGVTDGQMRATALPVVIPELRATTLWVTATAAAGAAITLTLPAAAAGQFHYITAIDMMLYASVARTGAAAAVQVTTTNMPGLPSWMFPTAQAVGVLDRYDVPLLTALKSSVAATATTVVAPAATGGIWRLNVGYYTGA